MAKGGFIMKCLTIGCDRPALARGLCRKCYRRVVQRIATGECVSWDTFDSSTIMSAAIQPASYYLDDSNKYRHGRPRTKQKESTARKDREMGMCLVGCGKQECSRGLCITCYQSAVREVKSGNTTWEELEREGLANPSKKPRKENAFYKKLSEKRQTCSLGSLPDAPEPSIGPLSPNDAETLRIAPNGSVVAFHPEVVESAATVVNEGTANYEAMLQPGASGQTMRDYGDPEVNAMMAAKSLADFRAGKHHSCESRIKELDPRSEAHQPPHPNDVPPWAR
jgi:hypothetical protein